MTGGGTIIATIPTNGVQDPAGNNNAVYTSMGDMIGYDLAPYPNVRRWLATMAARPGWDEANAAFHGWRNAVRAAA